MKWERERSGEVSSEGEITVSGEERMILAKCGLSVQGYLDAQVPSFSHVPTSGIVAYCFNGGWYIEPNSCTGEWRVVGKVSDFDWGL